MRDRKLWAALLACVLLTGCGTTQPPVEEQPAQPGETIAYVPLDDRPDNEERVVYLAESLGYRLEMPERDLYHTALDQQPTNSNGTQSGDRGKLFQWVMEQEQAGCNRYILSMDQLLSGGLVHSRAMFRHEDISCRLDGQPRTLSEYEMMGVLLQTLAEDPENRVWLLDSVMRLAPTVGYQGGTLEEYNALRAYGAEPRPELTGAELTLGGVQDHYTLNAAGEQLDPADYGLTDAWMTEYLAARGRKLDLSCTMMETVTGLQAEHIHVLIGIDDSSEENSIQKNEIAYLRSLLREGDALLSGVDDLAFKAVAKLYLEDAGWEGADACVRYYGGTEDQPACAYDYKPLTEIVEEHFDFFDLTLTEEQCDFSVLVLTQPADPAQGAAYYNALIRQLEANADARVPTVLIDAGNNQYGTAFHDALTEKFPLGLLLSYAGFLDMAIVTGTALSHGVARYAWLERGGENAAATGAWQKSHAEAVLLDFCYRNTVRDDLSAWVRQQGGDPNNFYVPPIDLEAARQQLENGMAESTKAVLKNFSRSNFILSLEEYRHSGGGLAGWGEISLSNWRFPWQRVFEVRMDLEISPPEAPHKQVLGIYYQ